ncbi:hypothetical protein F2Q68_00017580 [Brassica cretica]|uniref:Jacalin-type lectin domain-containing protein n=1 Tax=Brassica cretica TaxID=69181 RepID=A0A8S9HKH6_BRACR|nr:hypothetical protein F2Q68_00017580 [Brassica cretica]
MAQKLDAKGGKQGNAWDDGVHDNVRKVYLGKGPDCIAFVKFEYVDGSKVVIGDEHGEKTQEVEEPLRRHLVLREDHTISRCVHLHLFPSLFSARFASLLGASGSVGFLHWIVGFKVVFGSSGAPARQE